MDIEIRKDLEKFYTYETWGIFNYGVQYPDIAKLIKEHDWNEALMIHFSSYLKKYKSNPQIYNEIKYSIIDYLRKDFSHPDMDMVGLCNLRDFLNYNPELFDSILEDVDDEIFINYIEEYENE